MTTALGLIGMAVFIVCTIAVAAAITYVVVRVTPAKTATQNRSTTKS